MFQPSPSPQAPEASSFALTSPAFRNGSPLPPQYATPAAGGENMSPALSWSGAPTGTKSFAIECVDLAPVAHNWVHWLVVDIPGNTTGVGEGTSGGGLPAGSRELDNTRGQAGWSGPQPPKGSGTHDYRFVIYALDIAQVNVSEQVSLDDFRKALDRHVLASASLIGTYEQ